MREFEQRQRLSPWTIIRSQGAYLKDRMTYGTDIAILMQCFRIGIHKERIKSGDEVWHTWTGQFIAYLSVHGFSMIDYATTELNPREQVRLVEVLVMFAPDIYYNFLRSHAEYPAGTQMNTVTLLLGEMLKQGKRKRGGVREFMTLLRESPHWDTIFPRLPQEIKWTQ